MGKTSLTVALRQFFSIYLVPLHEDFNCTYDDDIYDLAVMDEFKGNKTIQWMNNWLDGTPMLLKRKSTSGFTKLFNIPTIVLSNYPLRECYPNVDSLRFATVERRFVQVHVDTPINVTF